MNKFLLYLLLSTIAFSSFAQGFPGRKTMDNNGLKSKVDYPIISGKAGSSGLKYGFSTPDMSKQKVVDEEMGAVSYIRNLSFGKDLKNARRSTKDMSYEFLTSVKADLKIAEPKSEFEVLEEVTDEKGIKRVRLQQKYKNVPVYGGELGLHSNTSGVIEFMLGKVFPTPKISVKPKFNESEALQLTYQDLGKVSIVQKTGMVSKFLAMDPDKGELMIYKHQDTERLVYHLTVRPNILERWVYFVDAHTGEVIDKYNHTCTLDGVVKASSRDLNNVQRTFGAYQIGQNYVMIDTEKKMFNRAESSLPDSPVGAILTIDARNGRVDDEDMELYHVVASNASQWNATAVSAHTNASISYDYFDRTFGRNSLNGTGGNIISVINITDEDGRGFDNAFWNGIYMGYGNGGEAFKPLAGSLDVAGHEMTHGVIENTAKLEYRNQSGALNESFADIFGAMIDRDNWTLGETVVNRSVFPSGALRSLQNPNQGGRNDPGYQPMFMSQYQVLRDTPEQDNGGVHINSGIPNHAYYLFATGNGMSKEKAEKVYYHALTRYLGRTSKFLDLRLAVIQSAKDLYGETEVAAARSAFDRVGIVESGNSSGGTTNPSKESEVVANPGQAQMVAFGMNSNDQRLYLANFAFNSAMSFTAITGQIGCLSKPSISDNGKVMVFVGNDQKIHALDLVTKQALNFSDNTGLKWFNAAISKDGKRIAAIANETQNNNYIYVFDLADGRGGTKFELYNPTYSQGVNSGKVNFAEALEWDLTGEYVVYDAQNQVGGWFSQTRKFYDVGVLRAWDPIKKTFGDGSIEKLFSDVPEGVSVGNPTFAKTNAGILAFDYIDENEDQYYILTLDLNKSSDALKYFEINTIGFPDFSKTDEYLTFDYVENNRNYIAGVKLRSDKITADLSSATALAIDKTYGVSFANGTRELPQVLEQVISIAPLQGQNPGTSVVIQASTTSGLPLVYGLTTTNASISGNRVTLGNTPGKVGVKVFQVGNAKYAAATAEAEFCITPPTPVLSDNGNTVRASGGTLYQFYVNGNPTGGFTNNPTLEKRWDGTYSVQNVTQDGCASGFSNVIVNNTVLANENTQKKIIILPNPVSEVLKVTVPEDDTFEALEIYSSAGAWQMSSKSLEVGVKELASGVYVLKVQTDKGSYSIKMVKL
jgi:bacillolysin